MKDEKAKQLLDKYLSGDCTPEEKKWIERAYNLESSKQTPQISEESYAVMKTEIWGGIERNKPRKAAFKTWPNMAIAASIILCLSIGVFFLLERPPVAETAQTVVANNITPGSNKAILTLANGKKIVLNGAQNGKLAIQGSTIVNKTTDGKLVYETNQTNAPADDVEKIAFNTMTTPKGGQYWIILPDGSRVLLNAASSLKYPTAFNQKERRVELIGEAYFEVAKNREKPFLVNVNDKQEIEILGTHFDVKAYVDDPDIRTTLLEGSVKLTIKTKQVILKPGQMAVNNMNGVLQVKQADMDEVMGWKDGLFVFNDANIKEVMKVVSRWYDIEVEYRGNVQSKKFWGTTSRYKNVQDLLNYMKITANIHYQIEGRRIILMD